MKKVYLIEINPLLLLTELFFFINSIYLFKLIPVVIPAYAGREYKGIFSLKEVFFYPKEYFFSFFCFLLGLIFLSGILVRTFLFAFYQWKLVGFILKFFFTSWSLSIFGTTVYMSFHYMAIEGLIIGLFTCGSYLLFYSTRKVQINM